MKKDAAKKGRKPSAKRQKFVEEYVQSGNAADAARRAGYSGDNHTLAQRGHELVTNSDIADAVQRRKEQAMLRAGITTDEVVGSIAEIATASLADVNPDDEFLKKAKKNKVDHLIKKVKVIYDKDGNVTSREYEMYSRLDALDKLLDVRGARKQPAANPVDTAKQALTDMLGRFPELTEDTARQIVSETFNVQVSELLT